MHKATFFLFLLLLVLGMMGTQAVHAQLETVSADLSLSTIPSDPAPRSQVTLTAQSYSVDLTRATLTWLYNGSTVTTGVGKTSITVTAPASGEVATATVRVSGLDTAPLSTSVVLNPGAVDLLWESTTGYTPPFYKGRASLAHGGTFRVVAIPSKNAPRQASFAWSQNDNASLERSGAGKSSALFENTLFNKTETIGVTVSGGVFEGNNKVTIVPKNPEVVVYQKKEGFIDYAKGALNELSLTGPGAVLRFEPFFFSVPDSILKNLSFRIRSGENESFEQDIPNEVGITRPQAGGESTVSVIINTAQYSLQNLTRLFTLTFN